MLLKILPTNNEHLVFYSDSAELLPGAFWATQVAWEIIGHSVCETRDFICFIGGAVDRKVLD